MVETNPARIRIVIAQSELGFLSRHCQPFDKADSAVHAGQAATAILDSARDNLEGEACAVPDMQSQKCRVRIGAKGVDIVQKQVLQLGPFGQQLAQNTIAQQVGDFIPVADRVQTLERHVVGIITGFARALSPIDQGMAQAIPNFLLLLIEHLLGHLLPKESQVPHRRDHSQSD